MSIRYLQHSFNRLDTAFSDNCCLTCGFCYARKNKCHPYSKKRFDDMFNWFFTQYTKNHPECKNAETQNKLHVTFYGGEPIFEWNNLVKEIPLRREQAAELGLTLHYCVVSNLAMLNSKRIDWLQKNNVGISCSIDGCQPAEDYWRKFQNGEGASKYVFPNAREITSRNMATTARCTITPETAKWLKESAIFLIENLGFNNAMCVPASGVNWTFETLEEYAHQLHELTDWWINKVKQNKWHGLYHISHMLPHIWGRKRKSGTCYAGKNLICADTRGYLWPCHRFGGGNPESKYCLGSIYTGITNTTMFNRITSLNFKNVIFKEECKTCQARFACNHFCINIMSAANDNITPVDCFFTKIHTKEAIRAHNTLVDNPSTSFLQHFRLCKSESLKRNEYNEQVQKHPEIEQKMLTPLTPKDIGSMNAQTF